MADSPTSRTLKELRKIGFDAEVVEKFNRYAGPFGKTFDLFNCIDVIGMMPGYGIVGVQATSGSNHSKRLDKIKAEPLMRRWVECGARLELWSWSKQGARGKRKLWTLRREELRLEDLVTA